jgi:DNA-binding NtrC family response regulator
MNATPPEEDRPAVFVVDDDAHLRALISAWVEAAGFHPVELPSGEACLAALPVETPAAVLLDLSMPGMGGAATLDRVRSNHRHLPVIVLTADRSVDTVVDLMRRGAYDFLPKPVDRTKLATTLVNAVEKHAMAMRLATLEREAEGQTIAGFVGASPTMRELYRQIDRVAASDISVFIHGESGTGKELAALAIHGRSGRSASPFVTINCAAIPESLQESELFGHERGAFTGAAQRRVGRFEQVAGGTLFLDEVAELAPNAQAKLLRVLQQRTIQRVGSGQEIEVDFRLLAATHQDLAAAVRAGRFREDLFYRIVVFELELPPLRDRQGDVALLAGHFLAQTGRELARRELRLAPAALAALERYAWPGNVRELQNVCRRAAVTCDGDTIGLADLPARLGAIGPPAGAAPATVSAPEAAPDPARAPLPAASAGAQVDGLAPVIGHLPPAEPEPPAPGPAAEEPAADGATAPALTLSGMERVAIVEALRRAGGNRARVSRELGIGRTTLYRKLKEYGIG